MTSRRMALLIVIAVASYFAATALLGDRASASVQEDDICWSPDVEFPTTCDEDDD